MKPIIQSKDFEKQFKQLVQTYPNLKIKIQTRLDIFINNRNSKLIKDHKLVGKMSGFKSFSIGGDLRIVYIEEHDHFYFYSIGTHNQVY